MNPNDRKDIMRHWSSWRKYIAEGGECSWPRDAFESLVDYFEEQNNDLLEKIRWFFECTDAMITVHGLLVYSKEKQPKRLGAYRRLAIMTGEAESDLREMI